MIVLAVRLECAACASVIGLPGDADEPMRGWITAHRAPHLTEVLLRLADGVVLRHAFPRPDIVRT